MTTTMMPIGLMVGVLNSTGHSVTFTDILIMVVIFGVVKIITDTLFNYFKNRKNNK